MAQARKAEEVWKAEEARRVEEERWAEMARQAEAVRQWEEAERQKAINEVWARMEREQQEEMQVRAQAIMVMQGGGTPGPSMVVAGPTPRACERFTVLLREPEGCMVSERGKAQACLLCQKVHKACIWPLGLTEVAAAMKTKTRREKRSSGQCT